MRFLLLVLLALPLPSFAQNILVRQSNGDSYYRTLPNETANDNYSTKGNTNPYTGKRGIKMRRTDSLASAVSAEGTGEYLLVPAIVRNDPKGTANRFNICGSALIALLDRGALGDLTEPEIQPLTVPRVFKIAESRFRMATAFDPKNYLYHTNLGVVLYRQGKKEEALAAIRRAMKLNPEDEQLKDYEAEILREKVTVKILDDADKD